MSIKDCIKDILHLINPFAAIRRGKMRKKLANKTPSFLCPNCIGGILFHDLGLQFRSPTVNLMMTQTDFVKFVQNAEHYLSQELVFFDKPDFNCPCAWLDDVTIHFTHYASPQEAMQKWNERKNRIDWDNLFVFLTERDGLTREEIESLANLKCRGVIVFTANHYADIPYTVQIPKYAQQGVVGNVLEKNWFDERREYEIYFDFVKWFNDANGAPYDVSPYVK